MASPDAEKRNRQDSALPTAARKRGPVNGGRQFVAVGRNTGAMAHFEQPTLLVDATKEAELLRLRGFDRVAIYQLVEVKA